MLKKLTIYCTLCGVVINKVLLKKQLKTLFLVNPQKNFNSQRLHVSHYFLFFCFFSNDDIICHLIIGESILFCIFYSDFILFYVAACLRTQEEKDFLKFRKKWKGKSGIYKLTFLPCRLFTYFGSCLLLRLACAQKILENVLNIITIILLKKRLFLALFIKTFGWDCFAALLLCCYSS